MDIIKGQTKRNQSDQIALLSIALTLWLAANVPHMRNAIQPQIRFAGSSGRP